MQFDKNYADRYYDPALSEFAHFPQTIDEWVQKSAAALSDLVGQLNLAYAGGPLNKFDIFASPGGNAPLVLHIHGGLWVMCDKRETHFHAARFHEHGIGFAGLNYTLAPDATLDQIVREVCTAVAFIHRNAASLGVDPAAIFLSGHSAGGHLACMAAGADWSGVHGLPMNPVKGVISISGLHDLEPLLHATFLQPAIALDPGNVGELSPARHPAPKGVRLVTAVGGLENAEYRRQTSLIEQSWSSILDARLVLPDCHHGTIVDALTAPDSALFHAVLALVNQSTGVAARKPISNTTSR
jgi:arylformamidase